MKITERIFFALRCVLIAGLIVAMILFTSIVFSGCGRKEQAVEEHYESRFKLVERWDDMLVYVDKQTGIGYGEYTGGALREMFPLYDSNGEHYRPNGWRDYG